MSGGGGKGGGSTKVEVTNSGTTNVNSTVDIVGLDDINAAIDLTLPQPFETKSESRNELAVTQPIVTESNSRTELAITEPIVTQNSSNNQMLLDIRPLVIDTCTKIEFGRLPSTCIRQPYHRHYGFTLFGMEIFGFTTTGEEQLIIQDLPEKPQAVWSGEQAATRQTTHRGRRPRPHQHEGGRLRIRLNT